jgi:hypothetical protein
MRLYRRIALALPALMVLSSALVGCTFASPKTKADGGHGADDDPPVVTTTTMSPLPPRPREIPLDGVDPCGILSAGQRVQLSLDNPPSEYVEASFGDARACTMRSNISGNVVRFALVTVQGVNVWLDENAQVDAKPITVGTFPALLIRTPGLDHMCNVELDVAEGQFLDVMFRDGGNATSATQDALCAGAERAAEAAMSSLLERH